MTMMFDGGGVGYPNVGTVVAGCCCGYLMHHLLAALDDSDGWRLFVF